jgi:hypothetical protein
VESQTIMLGNGRSSVPDAPLVGHDDGLTTPFPICSGVSKKIGLLASWPSSFPTALHPARSSQCHIVAYSPTGHQRSRAPAPPPRCSDLTSRRPLCPHVTPPHLLPRAPNHQLPFFRDPFVASLKSMWAPSSPLLALGRCLR